MVSNKESKHGGGYTVEVPTHVCKCAEAVNLGWRVEKNGAEILGWDFHIFFGSVGNRPT